jgi:hypothetical protein
LTSRVQGFVTHMAAKTHNNALERQDRSVETHLL